MDISFSDIARLSATMSDNDSLVVSEKSGVQVADLGNVEVCQNLAAGTHALSKEELFAALESQTSKTFVAQLRRGLDNDKPLSARLIRQVVHDSQAEIETEAHLAQLTDGLREKADGATLATDFDGLIKELMSDKVAEATVKSEPCVKPLADFDAARGAVQEAKAALGRQHDPDLIEALAEAEMDLATAAHALAEAVRTAAHGLSDGAKDRLAALDDYATEMEMNARRLDEITLTLDFADLDRLTGEMPKAPVDAQAAMDAIKSFKEKARPFLAVLAKIDTLDPNDPEDPEAKAPALLNAAALAWNALNAQFEQLRQAPGLNTRAVNELAANLAAMKTRLEGCAADVQHTMQHVLYEHVHAMLRDAADSADKLYHDPHYQDPDYSDFRDCLMTAKQSVNDLLDALDRIPEADRPKALVEALTDDRSPVHQPLQTVLQLPALGDMDAHVTKLIGLHDLKARLDSLSSAFAEGAFKNPAEHLDVRILGEVLNGEVDLMNYLALKEANLPEEMFRTDLDVEHAEMKGHAGTGAFNTVDFYEIRDIRTNRTERFVVKNVELSQDSGAVCSVAALFSSASHARNAAKLNYASWKSANLIGCGDVITRSGVVRLGNHYQLVQETAPGDDLLKIRKGDLFNQRTQAYDLTLKRRIWRETHIACAKLEWADWLSGQLDRTVKNEMFDFKVETDPKHPEKVPHVEVSLKGIDNDASFPERRTGLNTFKREDGRDIIGEDTYSQRKVEQMILKFGVRSMRPPVFLPLTVQMKLAKLTEPDFIREMSPYLSTDALKAAVARFREMKNAAQNWPKDRVIDDTKGVDSMTDAEVNAEMDRIDKAYDIAYNNQKKRVGKYLMCNAGGFFGYLCGFIPA